MFDLDGTLIDSRRDLVECISATLRQFNLPELPGDLVAGFIGDGAAALVERSLSAAGGSTAVKDRALDYFLSYYREHLLDHTCLYPGVVSALHHLQSGPDPPLMAVLTNKPVDPSRRICAALGLAPFLFQNYGGNSFPTKKPAPEGLLALWRAAEQLHGSVISPCDVVMVGDSEVDVQTARNAGVTAWGCTWGYATAKMLHEGADALATTPSDWVRFARLQYILPSAASEAEGQS